MFWEKIGAEIRPMKVCYLNLFSNRTRVWGTKYLELELICPQNGTAVRFENGSYLFPKPPFSSCMPPLVWRKLAPKIVAGGVLPLKFVPGGVVSLELCYPRGCVISEICPRGCVISEIHPRVCVISEIHPRGVFSLKLVPGVCYPRGCYPRSVLSLKKKCFTRRCKIPGGA